MSRHWHADRDETAGIQFEGAPDLLRLIASLCRRPWRYWRETRLPVIRLVRPPGGPDPLGGLSAWLNDAGGAVPYARTGAALSPRQPAAVEDLLDRAVTELAREFRGGRLRFPHYGLGLWLLHLKPLPAGTAPDREREQIAERLQVHLRQRLVDNDFGESLADAVGDFPWWVRLTARSLPRVGLILMRRSWRPPRWFARQPIAAPHRHSFYGLARAFAQRDFVARHADQVDRLLTDAFLQDLRVAYRRTSVLGAGRRRTSYPVLLVDADSPAAERLLTLIEESRNTPVRVRRGARARLRRDPLLVITDPETAKLKDRTYPLDAEPAYDDWLAWQQASRGDHRRYLELTLPTETGRAGAWRDLVDTGLPRRRTPLMASLLPLLLVVALAAVVVVNDRRCSAPWSADPHRTLQKEALDAHSSQCIGLSDGGFRFFDDPPGADAGVAGQLRTVESYIAETNATAVKDPDYVSVVYLSTLTNTTVGGYQAALEELRGFALAQRELLNAEVPIRLLLANGGDQMNYGGRAAELIAGAARRLRIVAVAGLGVSRTGVRDALVTLGGAGIATLGTLLSADQLTATTAYYHQVGPTDQREAAIAAYYAKKSGVTEASIYYAGDPADLYSSNLADDVRAAFAARGIKIRQKTAYRTAAPASSGADVTSLGQQACPAEKGYLVFFAGRPDEFNNFLLGMRGSCLSGYPRILAGDAITQFVLAHRTGNFPGLSLDYMSEASGVAWAPACSAAKWQPFFSLYFAAGFGPLCDTGQAVRAMFGWDAVQTIEAAAIRVRAQNSNPLYPGALLQGLNSLTGQFAVSGVTGRIEFSGTAAVPQAPVNKAMLVVGTDSDGLPVLQLLCGDIPTALAPDSGCPTD
jgi:hypothetical protein